MEFDKKIKIVKPGETTKVCNYCGKFVKDLCSVRINDFHFGENYQDQKRYYSSNSVYIHALCFEEWARERVDEINKNIKKIKDNAKEVVTEKI